MDRPATRDLDLSRPKNKAFKQLYDLTRIRGPNPSFPLKQVSIYYLQMTSGTQCSDVIV